MVLMNGSPRPAVRVRGWTRKARTVAAVAAACALVALVGAACASGSARSAGAVGASGATGSAGQGAPAALSVITATSPVLTAAWPYYGTRVEPAIPRPGFTFTDTSGAAYDIKARTQGRVTVLFFGYTSCPDECPTTMADLASALRELTPRQQAKVIVLFVSVDPDRDTLPVLRAYLDRFDHGFVGLRGPLAAVAADAASIGVPVDSPSTDAAGTTTVGHGTESLVFAADGIARFFWTPQTPVSQIAHDFRLLVG
jgi:protein SCO1/2